MSDKTTASSGGIGFCGLLAIAFIVLKIMGYINWAWWWVLAPLWIPFLIVAIIFICVGIYAILQGIFSKRRIKARRNRNMY